MTTEMPGLGAILEALGSDREFARTASGPFRLALRETGPVTERRCKKSAPTRYRSSRWPLSLASCRAQAPPTPFPLDTCHDKPTVEDPPSWLAFEAEPALVAVSARVALGTVPRDESLILAPGTAPSLIFATVTAFFFNCLVPTPFFAS